MPLPAISKNYNRFGENFSSKPCFLDDLTEECNLSATDIQAPWDYKTQVYLSIR